MPTSQPWGGSERARMQMHTTQACEKQLLQSPRLPALTVYTLADMFHCCSDKWKHTHGVNCTRLRHLQFHCFRGGGKRSVSVGPDHWAKEIKMIGWIILTGSPFWLRYDLWRSADNYGVSHRSPECINIQSRKRIQESRAYVCVMKTSASCLLPFFFTVLISPGFFFWV